MNTGFIYVISSPSTDRIYIGSTTETLAQRFNRHKCDYNACSSREITKYGDAFIELLEEVEYNDKDELRWKEREYQDIFKDQCINNYRAITTEEEDKEYHKERNKEYYEKNKKKIKEIQKKYREKNREKLREKAKKKI